MPPGPVQAGVRPVMGEGTVCACASRIAAGEAIPSSVAPAPTSVPPTKSRRVMLGRSSGQQPVFSVVILTHPSGSKDAAASAAVMVVIGLKTNLFGRMTYTLQLLSN